MAPPGDMGKAGMTVLVLILTVQSVVTAPEALLAWLVGA